MIHIKVCGITRPGDAMLAAELGASAIGFIFWPKSPRYVAPARARAIAAMLPPMVTPIGVFVDQTARHVARVARIVGLGAVQLHGRETRDFCRRLGLRVIKAFGVGNGFSPTEVARYPRSVTILLDAHDPVLIGGTGRTIDWHAAATLARTRRVILSGGLSPANVAAAIAAVGPYALDVSSGVEARPGIKDAAKLRAFFDVVRNLGVARAGEPKVMR